MARPARSIIADSPPRRRLGLALGVVGTFDSAIVGAMMQGATALPFLAAHHHDAECFCSRRIEQADRACGSTGETMASPVQGNS